MSLLHKDASVFVGVIHGFGGFVVTAPRTINPIGFKAED